MGRTSGTRQPGIGGPAKGAGKPAAPFTADSETRQTETVAHLDNGDLEEQGYRGQQRRLKRQRQEAAWKALDALVLDKEHAWHGNAIKETLNRTEGIPVQKIETTGKDGGPLQSVGVVTNDPVEAARVYQQLMGGRD